MRRVQRRRARCAAEPQRCVRPSPRSHIYGENGDGSTEPQAASWRPCASVERPLVPRARCVACSSTYYKLQSEWHGAGSAAFVRGPLGRISIDQIASVTQHPTLTPCAWFKPDIYWAKCRVFSDYRAQSAVRGASRAVDRRGLQTSRIRGERAIFIHQLRRRVRSASLVSLERSSTRSSTGSSRTGPLGAGLDALGGRRRLHARAARAGPRAVSPPTRA